MKELLTYIVQSLVEKSDEVSVTEHETGGETVFEVRVAALSARRPPAAPQINDGFASPDW